MYIVIELQTNANGTVGNLVYSYADRNGHSRTYGYSDTYSYTYTGAHAYTYC